MDRDLVALDGHEHHDLKKIPGAVGSEHEPAVRIVTEIFNRLRMRDRMHDVGTDDAVSERRRMNLHTQVS